MHLIIIPGMMVVNIFRGIYIFIIEIIMHHHCDHCQIKIADCYITITIPGIQVYNIRIYKSKIKSSIIIIEII